TAAPVLLPPRQGTCRERRALWLAVLRRVEPVAGRSSSGRPCPEGPLPPTRVVAARPKPWPPWPGGQARPAWGASIPPSRKTVVSERRSALVARAGSLRDAGYGSVSGTRTPGGAPEEPV